MSRRKSKSEAAKRAKCEWPHNEALHRLELDGVVEYLERKFVENQPRPESASQVLALLRKAAHYTGLGFQPTNRNELKAAIGDIPEELTTPERLGDLLPVLWADYRLWWALSQKPPGKGVLKESLAAYLLLKFYNVLVPFRDSVWKQLRNRQEQWNYLQVLMLSNATLFFNVQDASAKDALSESERGFLNEKLLGNLLRRYTANPLRDWRPVLWRAQLPKAVLRRLQQAAGKLAEDSAWCLAHPDLLLPSRAPALPHRVRSLREAKAIEDMVVMLRRDVGLTNYALAKQSMGRVTAAGRRLARDAKLLACYRDGLPVKFHKSFRNRNVPKRSP